MSVGAAAPSAAAAAVTICQKRRRPYTEKGRGRGRAGDGGLDSTDSETDNTRTRAQAPASNRATNQPKERKKERRGKGKRDKINSNKQNKDPNIKTSIVNHLVCLLVDSLFCFFSSPSLSESVCILLIQKCAAFGSSRRFMYARSSTSGCWAKYSSLSGSASSLLSKPSMLP